MDAHELRYKEEKYEMSGFFLSIEIHNVAGTVDGDHAKPYMQNFMSLKINLPLHWTFWYLFVWIRWDSSEKLKISKIGWINPAAELLIIPHMNQTEMNKASPSFQPNDNMVPKFSICGVSLAFKRQYHWLKGGCVLVLTEFFFGKLNPESKSYNFRLLFDAMSFCTTPSPFLGSGGAN